jgi:hypothetical protein
MGALEVRGKPEFFSRLLAEVLFASFQPYENELGTKLLLVVGDSLEVKKPSFVTPLVYFCNKIMLGLHYIATTIGSSQLTIRSLHYRC